MNDHDDKNSGIDGSVHEIERLRRELESVKAEAQRYRVTAEGLQKAADDRFARNTALFEAISRVQSLFITNTDPHTLFEELLATLLSLTGSEYGFIGDIFHRQDGTPYLKTRALTNIAWNEETKALYDRYASMGMEFTNLTSLFGSVMTTGKAVISNNPEVDPRRCGIPAGHPPLIAFMGLPFYNGADMVGMLGLANRRGGYDTELIDHLQPLLATCAHILEGYKIDQRRKAVEAELRSSEASLENAQRIACIGNWDWDIPNHGLWWSDEIYRIFGVEPHEFGATYEAFIGYVHPDDRGAVAEVVGDALQKKKGYSVSHRIVLKDGSIKTVHEQGEAVFSQEGTPVRMCGTVQDITEQVRMEATLRESEERYRTLFEDSRDVVFITTPDGRIIDINPAGLSLFGYGSKDDFRSINASQFYSDPAERDFFRSSIESHGFVKDLELKLKRKDGERLVVSMTATAVRDKQGDITAFRGIVRDMTNYKKLEQQLLHSQKMEAVGQLTGGIAHDFNNILTGIIGYSSVLLMRDGDGPANMDYVRHIQGLAERASKLTQGLLAFSRKQVVSLAPVDLNDIIRGIEHLLTKIVREDIEFRVDIYGGSLVVMADSGQIEQVIINLVANAKDAMPSGGRMTISTGLTRFDEEAAAAYSGLKGPGDYACLSVSDTGIGMDEKTKGRIFEPFFTTKEVGKGTGLGLSIVYGIMSGHRGAINVYSELGVGTTFKAYLPIAVGSEKRPDDFLTGPPPSGTETILVAEDDDDVVGVMRTILEGAGYSVITAFDGLDAVKRFKESRGSIQLVIMDVIMPRKNGKEAYDEITGIAPGTRVIFTSGYTEDIINNGVIFDEGLDFISKPLNSGTLLRKVREVLDRER